MDPHYLTTCLVCGANAEAGTKYCGQCGQSLDPLAPTPPSSPHLPKQLRWYQNIWLILFMLFFVVGPFGLPLVWKHPRLSQRAKIILTLIMVVYTVVLVELTMQAIRAVMGQVDQFNSTLSF